MLLLRLAIGLAGLVFALAPAFAEPRVALVIGNSNYGGELGQLPNPVNDAKLMAETLRKVGFQVVEVEDADQGALKQAIVDFGDKLSEAGAGATGLFFYVGHGVQMGGENYLRQIAEMSFFLGWASYRDDDRVQAAALLAQASDAKAPDLLACAAARALLVKMARE